MNNTPECPRCQGLDTLVHKFIECDYVKRIWFEVFKYTRTTINPATIDPIEAAFGAYKATNLAIITLNAEIILRLSYLKPDNYLIHPKFFLRAAVATVLRNEKQGEVKDMLKSIWDSMTN